MEGIAEDQSNSEPPSQTGPWDATSEDEGPTNMVDMVDMNNNLEIPPSTLDGGI